MGQRDSQRGTDPIHSISGCELLCLTGPSVVSLSLQHSPEGRQTNWRTSGYGRAASQLRPVPVHPPCSGLCTTPLMCCLLLASVTSVSSHSFSVQCACLFHMHLSFRLSFVPLWHALSAFTLAFVSGPETLHTGERRCSLGYAARPKKDEGFLRGVISTHGVYSPTVLLWVQS